MKRELDVELVDAKGRRVSLKKLTAGRTGGTVSIAEIERHFREALADADKGEPDEPEHRDP